MLNSFQARTPLELTLTPIVEALVGEAKQQGMSFDELLLVAMNWALQKFQTEEEFSHGKLAVLKAFEASLIKEFEITGTISGPRSER